MCACPLACFGGYMWNTGRTDPVAAVQHLAVGNNNKSFDDLVRHFDANGIKVKEFEFQPLNLGLGATRSFRTEPKGSIMVTKLDASDRVEAAELRTLSSQGFKDHGLLRVRVQVNGSFVLTVLPSDHPKRKEIERVFGSF